MAWCRGSAGVEEPGMHALGLPRNLGGPRRSTEIQVALGTARRVPGPRQRHLAAEGSEPNRCEVVRTAEQQRGMRKAARKSALAIVPSSQGNAARADPEEGRASRTGNEICWEET